MVGTIKWDCWYIYVGPAPAVPLQRSKTALVVTDTRPQLYVDLERQARNDAEKAMKVCDRVFSRAVEALIF